MAKFKNPQMKCVDNPESETLYCNFLRKAKLENGSFTNLTKFMLFLEKEIGEKLTNAGFLWDTIGESSNYQVLTERTILFLRKNEVLFYSNLIDIRKNLRDFLKNGKQ